MSRASALGNSAWPHPLQSFLACAKMKKAYRQMRLPNGRRTGPIRLSMLLENTGEEVTVREVGFVLGKNTMC